MADGSSLLPTPLKPPRGQKEASGRNPYIDLMLSTPQLRATPGPSDERTLSERFRLNMEAGKRQTLGGALESVAFDPRRTGEDLDLDNPGDVADHLRGLNIRENEERWNAMRPARTPAEIAVAVGGQLVGTAMSPETFLGLPTRVVTSGATALSRIFRAGVAGAAINTGVDPVVQGLRMKAGLQDEYSGTQTAISAALGLALPAGVQSGIEALRPRVPNPFDLKPDAPPEPGTQSRARPEPPRAQAAPEPAEPRPQQSEATPAPRATEPEPAPQPVADVAPEPADLAPEMEPAIPPPRTARSINSQQVGTAEALRRSGRPSLVPGMEGQIEPDPIAQNILTDHASQIASIDDFLAASGVAGVKPLAGGASSVVLDAGNLVVRIGEGVLRTVPNAPYVLRPINATTIGRLRVEILPKVDTAGITEADVSTMKARVSADDLRWDDAGTDNLGRLPDGSLVIIDGSVSPAGGTARTARPSAEAEPDIVAEATAAARQPTPAVIPEFTPDASVATAPSPGARAGTFMFDVQDLQVDARTFQFKSEGDAAEGVSPILRGVTEWDPSAAGQLIVWQRSDGTLFVADGHQRTGLARRLIQSGQETDIRIPGLLYREVDGFSPEDVTAIAAVKNIKEGSGSLVDAAKVLRLRPERIREIEEIGRTQTRQAVALARLADEPWRMVINDVIDARYGAVIGRIIPDDGALQEAAAKAINRMDPANEDEAEILVRRVRESDLVKGEEAAQGSLLADFEGPDSTVAEEVRIVSRVIKTLSKDKNIMRRVAANAETIERVGSKIAREQTISAADEAAALARIVESVAFSRGEVRDALLELAKDLKNGSRSIGEAVEAFIVALRRAETVSSKRGSAGGAGRPEDETGSQDETGAGLFGSRIEPERAPEPEPEVAAGEPIKIGTGDRLVSVSGRPLEPVPRLDFSTDGKARNSLKRLDAWLVDEAIKEAEATGNDFVLTQMRALDPKALSQADRDAVNLVVFGNAGGATKQALGREEVILADLIAESQPVGVNDAGERLYDNSRGRFRVRMDSPSQPEGYPDFGGDLAPVEAGRELPMMPSDDSTRLDQIGFRQDNPAVSRGATSWLAEKQAIADETYDTRRGITGATTGWLRNPVALPIEAVSGLPGARGEVRGPGDPQFDDLLERVTREGWSDENPILVEINHRGEAFITEGNTRAAIARQIGRNSVRAEVRWLNGGEMAEGDWTPQKVAELLTVEGQSRPPTTEVGADGKPQLVLPGAERTADAQIAQRRADEPMRPRAIQKRDAGPLFDDGAQQIDLLDLVRMAEGKPKDELFFSQSLRRQPMRGETNRSELGVPESAATPQAERLRSISERLSGALGLTVRQGRISVRGALGVYKVQSGVVRLKELDAFDVLAHEGGHGLHLLPANKAAVDAIIDRHEAEVIRLAYQGTAPGTEREEGFAEWFRLFMTNPGYAEREAPAFAADFEEWLRVERPQLDTDIRAAQDAYRDWLQAPSRQVLTGDLVSSGAPPITTRIGRAMETDRAPSGESLMSMMGRFYTWTFDRLHPVNRSVRALLQIHKRNTGQSLELRAASDPYKLLRLAASSHQAGHIDLIQGVVPYRRLDPQGPSVAEALELAIGKNWFGNWRADEMIDFGGYLVARRSIVEMERFLNHEVPNPPGKLTMGDYRQAVEDYEAAFPNFRPAAELIYEWNRNLLQKKYDAGLISVSYYERALEKPDYVPFRRDFSEKIEELIRPAGPGGTNRQNIMKAYRGSLRSIINPIESMMSDAYSVAAIIARNDAIAALADLAVKAGPGGGAIAEHIPASQLKPFEVDVLEALRKAGKDAGLNRAELDDLIQAASERLDSENVITTLFRAGEAPEGGEPIVYYWRGGQRHALRVADRRFGKDLYEAVTQIGTEQSSWAINMLAIPARALRMGITTSPEFLLANYLRDQITAFVLNTKFIPLVSGAHGVLDEVAQTRTARLYAQAGGIMGGANVASLDQARIGRSISALSRKGYTIKRLKDPRELLKLTEVSETGTRIALFRQYFAAARKQGLSEYEAVVEAAFQSRDFIDFGRHGSKMLVARRLVTFLNAALQGTDKSVRTLVADLRPMAKVFRGEAMTASERALVNRSAQAWLKISALTALSATYALTYRDDPEWQQASEYLRATHWLFKMPGGEWAVIPKPYELATFMNFGERMAEGLSSEDPTWAEKWMRSWAYTLAVPVEPAGLMVPAEIGFNYDTFRDRPIVQQWDLGLEPWQQFYAYTSEFSKSVGKAINVSPAKIDHLIVGWTGSWGRNLLAASNALFDPQRRSEALYDWPVTGRFVKNLARGSDATDKFYGLVSETSGRLERKNNAYKEMIARGQDVEASQFYGSLKDDEKVWVSLNQLETADEKRVHPLRRASDILRVYSGMRKDIANRNVIGTLSKRKIEVNATLAAAINDQLGRAATAETRNAMIVVGERGWANREVMETDSYLDAVRQLSPVVADEIEDRLAKAKVLPFEGVRSVWPELRDRLLDEGAEAYVGDLRAKALTGRQTGGTPAREARAPDLLPILP